MKVTETFTAMNQYNRPYTNGSGMLAYYEARVTVSIEDRTMSATSHLAAHLYVLGGEGMKQASFRRARKAVMQLIENELFKQGEKA